jgi:hypothetical protein
MSDLYRLRYVKGAHDDRFPLLRYPRESTPAVPRETAELMRRAMPHPELFEIVEEGQ